MPTGALLPGRGAPNGSQRLMADWTEVSLTVLWAEPTRSRRAECHVPPAW